MKKSILSMVLGIVGVCLSCALIGIVPSIIALVLGIKAVKVVENKGMAKAGIVLGIIGIVCSIAIPVWALSSPETMYEAAKDETLVVEETVDKEAEEEQARLEAEELAAKEKAEAKKEAEEKAAKEAEEKAKEEKEAAEKKAKKEAEEKAAKEAKEKKEKEEAAAKEAEEKKEAETKKTTEEFTCPTAPEGISDAVAMYEWLCAVGYTVDELTGISDTEFLDIYNYTLDYINSFSVSYNDACLAIIESGYVDRETVKNNFPITNYEIYNELIMEQEMLTVDNSMDVKELYNEDLFNWFRNHTGETIKTTARFASDGSSDYICFYNGDKTLLTVASWSGYKPNLLNNDAVRVEFKYDYTDNLNQIHINVISAEYLPEN